MSAAHDLLDRGDEIAARMAFKECYQRLCQSARDRCTPVSWSVSLGWDAQGREPVIRAALERGRLTAQQATVYLPNFEATEVLEPPAEVKALADRMSQS